MDASSAFAGVPLGLPVCSAALPPLPVVNEVADAEEPSASHPPPLPPRAPPPLPARHLPSPLPSVLPSVPEGGHSRAVSTESVFENPSAIATPEFNPPSVNLNL